ncbi:hypothetical protein EJB05_01858 [Eragrostis curvula]|uniref:Uncharacterized protein n=1 Tax=Eragrostis curvula TaxID=38414 RepID=A0A5J9WRB1_9POAL|nr:hypothetical protein EJB05_01858 [Eragrostis curvula]
MSSVWFFVHLFLDSGFPGCAAMGASDEGDVQRRRWVMVILRAGDIVVSAIFKLLDFGGAEVVHYIIQLPSALKVIFILFEREQMKIIRARGSASFKLEKHMLNYPKYNHNRILVSPEVPYAL